MQGFVTDRSLPSGVRLAVGLPEPEPAQSEVVVEVHAYSVNGGEVALLEHFPDGWRPGFDVAGVVVSPAADGSGPPAGTRVVCGVDSHGWSERVAAGTHRMAPLPDNVSFEDAATLYIAGLTALRSLRLSSILGRRVLVTGATGGVGQFAVQLALLGGAHVTALVSRPEREQEAARLGAHHVVSSLAEPLEPFDLVLDNVGGETMKQSAPMLADGGTLALVGVVGGPAELSLFDFSGPRQGPPPKIVAFNLLWPQDTIGEDLATLVRLIAEGSLRPWLGSVSDWFETPDVLDALRRRDIRGKAVLVRPTA